jgi:hypothetical protein
MTSHKQHTTNIRKRLRTLFTGAFADGEEGEQIRNKHLAEDYANEACSLFLTLLDELEMENNQPELMLAYPTHVCVKNPAYTLVRELNTKISHIKSSLKGKENL